MKLFKKILMIGLMVAAIPQGLSASLPQSPSLLSRVCSYVPFKSTLGLGLGLMGASAYCWYKLPQLEAQSDKADKKACLPDLERPKFEMKNVKVELKVINEIRIKLESISDCQAKITPENKDLLGEINVLLEKISDNRILNSQLSKVQIKYQDIEKLLGVMLEEEQEHFADTSTGLPTKSGRNFVNELCAEEVHFCEALEKLYSSCQLQIESLNNYKNTPEYKAALKKRKEQQELYDTQARRVDTYNRPIRIERLTLRNRILSYENLKFNCGIFGISLISLAGISKYFSR